MEKRNRHQAAQQAQFNIQRRMKIGVASAAAVATLFVAGKSFGANGTWVGGGADTNWTTSGNWTGGTIPGANDGTFISTDTATFGDLTSNGLTAPVISDLNRNVKNITYSSASGFPPQYTIGSALTVNTPNPNNPLYLTGGGELLVSSNINTATGSNDGINDPLFIEGSTYTFEDDSPFNTVGGIKINGAVTGSPTSPTTLTLQGSNYGTTQGQSGNAQFNGVISDGAGGPLSIVKNGASGSVWEIDNASTTPNSFTGSVTINAGAIRFKNAGDLPSTAVVTVGSTGVLRLGAGFSIPSITINSDGGTGGTSGVDILTLITSTGPALTLQLEATGVAQPSISTPFILAGTGAAGSGGVQVNGDATFTDKVSLGTAMDLGGVNRIFNINTLGTNDTDLQLGGVISDTGGAGGGGIIKTGVGSLKLNNVAETFTGPIEVQNGVLKLIGTTTANTLGGLNALTIDGGNFNLNPDGVTAGDGNTTVASTNFTSGSISGATPTAATIQTPASLLAPSFNFNVGLGNTFTANAVLANGTGGPSPLITNAASAGTAILNKANTYTGATTVNGGALDISATGSIVSTNVTVALGATLNASAASTNSGLSTSTALVSSGNVFITASGGSSVATTTVASVTVHSGGAVTLSDPATPNHAGRSLLVTSALTLDGGSNSWGGKVNLNGNDMIVKGVGPAGLTNITNQLKEGFNAGTGYWNGANGIVSGTAANDTTYMTTLGSRAGGITFDGVTTTASDVLVKYTYYGDANLDGSVNGGDYTQIDNGYAMHLTGWQNGDFNYDGVVDGSDFSLIDNTANQINARGASALAIVASPADLVASPADVPEPTTLALLGIGAFGLLSRRRRQLV